MKRKVSLSDISDGKLYALNDMVKADCAGCKGCSRCCQGMGNSIILDPYDIYNLTTGLEKSFEELLQIQAIELNVADGIILPNLSMSSAEEKCFFLNNEGRCSIHNIRPGICRLFPLGRYYENGDFKYFLQINECAMTNRSKIKVENWIDIKNIKQNHQFINCWHGIINEVGELINTSTDDDFRKNLNMFLLSVFYMTPYDANEDFYSQFDLRVEKFRSIA